MMFVARIFVTSISLLTFLTTFISISAFALQIDVDKSSIASAIFSQGEWKVIITKDRIWI
jgi:hypothetical protein